MRILYVHSLMFHHRTWNRVVQRLAGEGIELLLSDQIGAVEILADFGGEIDLLIADLAVGIPNYERLLSIGWSVAHRMGPAAEMPPDFTTFPADTVAEFKAYISSVSVQNYANGIRLLAAKAGMCIVVDPPLKVATTGIYHPDAPYPFADSKTYRQWFGGRVKDPQAPWIGLLFYYSQLVSKRIRPTWMP